MRRCGKIKGLFNANKLFFKELFKSGKAYVLLQLILIVLVIPISYINAFAPKRFIDNITINHNLQIALLWIATLLFFKFFDLFSKNVLLVLKKRAVCKAKIKTKQYTYKKLEQIDLTFFEDSDNLDLYNKALSYVEYGGETYLNLLVSAISSILTLSTMTYISLQFEWWLWIFLISLALIQLFTDRIMKKISFKYEMERVKRDRKQNYFNGLPTTKDVIAEIKVNSSMDFFFDKYKKSYEENRIFQEKHDIKVHLLSYLFAFPGDLFVFFCYWLIGSRMIGGSSTIGDYALFFTMISSINSHIKMIISTTNMFYEQSLLASVYLKFVQNETFFSSQSKELQSIGGEPFKEIVFDNVSFQYPGRSIPAVKNIFLHIKRGERITIVGYNGAGKTTFIKLLAAVFQPTTGSIFYNGCLLNKIQIKSYWDKIGVVFQNHQEFSMSILDNILLGKENVSEEKIWDALSKVGLETKISENPNRLDLQLTRVFDKNGMDFSGGERQKLAIARLMVKDAEVFVFDEPTSALDPRSESLLYTSISQMPLDKTVIMISHRLSSVFFSDRVLFFKDGEIIADGKHKDLLFSCKEYKELYEMQSSKYLSN